MPRSVELEPLDIMPHHRGPSRRIHFEKQLNEMGKRVGALTDREMWAALEKLCRENERGAWFCVDLRSGYFMARNEEELERHLNADENRAKLLAQQVQIQGQAVGLCQPG